MEGRAESVARCVTELAEKISNLSKGTGSKEGGEAGGKEILGGGEGGSRGGRWERRNGGGGEV